MTYLKFITLMGLAFLAFSPSVLAQDDKKQPAAARVIVTAVKKESVSDHVEALGTLRANETVVLTATVTEIVSGINFTDGQRVEKGHVLIEMASGEPKAQLDQAQAVAEEAKQQLERKQVLAKQGATSQSLLDQGQRDYDAARARLREVQSKLSDYIIAAPFDGVVGMRNISVGALLQPGTKITTLDDDSVMKLDFAVPSVFLNDLKTGAPIVARAREYPGQDFKGAVSSIDSQIDPVTRSINVRAQIPNEEHVLKPGLLMSVNLMSNPREAILIPEESLVPEGRENFVFVIGAGNKTEKRKIVIGARQPGKVEITEGLQEGEKIITHGTMNARPGQEVSVIAEEQGGENLKNILEKAGEKK